MEWIRDFFAYLRDLEGLIRWGGFAILTGIVYAETGLLIGFFLPGDSLLFTAGALVGTGILKPPALLPQGPGAGLVLLMCLLAAASIAGDSTGYWFGRKTGPRLFSRPDSRLFKKRHLQAAQQLYERVGGKIVMFARWMPFVRTFAPIVAGVAEMPYRTFLFFSVIGGIVWVCSMTSLGYLLGQNPWVRANNEKVIIAIVLVSVIPPIRHWLKERRSGGDT